MKAVAIAAILLTTLPDGISDATTRIEGERRVTNSIGMTLMKIPRGQFLMGNHESLEGLERAFPQYEPVRIAELTDEGPLHRVRITRDFSMGIHEVTIGQFKRFVQEADYVAEPERDGTGGYGVDLKSGRWVEGRRPGYSWHDPGFPQGDDHPVVNITWNDAVAFCQWLSRKEGRTYRLPTEAEWEYACRAGTTTRYHCGDDPESLAGAAAIYDAESRRVFPEWENYALNARDGYPFTAPVGSFPPNAFGLHDMHGNVWEWCSDHYNKDYYAVSPENDPQGPATGGMQCAGGRHGIAGRFTPARLIATSTRRGVVTSTWACGWCSRKIGRGKSKNSEIRNPKQNRNERIQNVMASFRAGPSGVAFRLGVSVLVHIPLPARPGGSCTGNPTSRCG